MNYLIDTNIVSEVRKAATCDQQLLGTNRSLMIMFHIDAPKQIQSAAPSLPPPASKSSESAESPFGAVIKPFLTAWTSADIK